MADPITPPVAPVPPAPDAEQKALSFVQRLVKSDKSAVVAGILHIAVLLVAAMKLKLSASDTAILGSIVAAGVAYFINLRLPPRA